MAQGVFCTRILDEARHGPHYPCMSVLRDMSKTAGRVRYITGQGVRSAWYSGQYALARRRSADFQRPAEPAFIPAHKPDPKALRKAYIDLFLQDRANIEAGLYPDPTPRDVHWQNLPSALKRARLFLRDVAAVDRRRLKRDGVEVRKSGRSDLGGFPAYYKQNFHYQTDGWLSEDSARLYDHQVETLFRGGADAMRRMALAELAHALNGQDQRRMRVLDLACGTGRFMQQTLRAFPCLGLTGIDLSPPYALHARRMIRRWPQAEVIEGRAEDLPFGDNHFDHILCIYLFHELPPGIRLRTIAQAARVLKAGGLFIIADSLQTGDNPGLDGFLEYFPEGFHEPYYKNYLGWDFAAPMQAAGFFPVHERLACLTKVQVWRKGNNNADNQSGAGHD